MLLLLEMPADTRPGKVRADATMGDGDAFTTRSNSTA